MQIIRSNSVWFLFDLMMDWNLNQPRNLICYATIIAGGKNLHRQGNLSGLKPARCFAMSAFLLKLFHLPRSLSIDASRCAAGCLFYWLDREICWELKVILGIHWKYFFNCSRLGLGIVVVSLRQLLPYARLSEFLRNVDGNVGDGTVWVR
jgi:hypothetical protein